MPKFYKKKKQYKKKARKHHKNANKFSNADWRLAKNVELKSGVYNFKEKIFDRLTMVGNASGVFFRSTNYTFNDVPDQTSYARLFDAYQIVGVKTKYVISNPHSSAGQITDNTSATANTLVQHSTPSVTLVYSPGDALVPTSMANLLETKGARLHRLNSGIVQTYIKPKPLLKLYNGSIDTDYKIPNSSKNTWIATAESDTEHYCLKEGWTGLNPLITYDVDRIRTYYFKFKIPK